MQNPTLDVIQESFEDVSLSDPKLTTKQPAARPGYLSRRPQSESCLQIHKSNSCTSLRPNSLSDLNLHKQQSVRLTPTQKYRRLQKIKQQELQTSLRRSDSLGINTQDFLSDDEIPDNFVVFNVPFSRTPTIAAPKKSLDAASESSASNRSSMLSVASNLTMCSEYSNLSTDAQKISLSLDTESDTRNERMMFMRRLSLQRFDLDKFHDRVSDERNKFISLSRPSNLPPKDEYESIKHDKDFESVVQKAIEREKKEEAARKQRLAKLQTQKLKDLVAWKESVLPKYPQSLTMPSTRELWWRGIPDKLKTEVWLRQVGFKNGVTDEELESLISRTHCKKQTGLTTVVKAWELKMGYSMNSSVKAIATVVYSTTLSTKHSLNILLGVTQSKKYRALSAIGSDAFLSQQLETFKRLLSMKNEALYTHFNKIQLDLIAPLSALFESLFASCTGPDIAPRILDIYIFEGIPFLLRAALALMLKINHKLYGNKDEILKVLHTNVSYELGDADSFIEMTRNIFK